jgi:hypothetical protein
MKGRPFFNSGNAIVERLGDGEERGLAIIMPFFGRRLGGEAGPVQTVEFVGAAVCQIESDQAQSCDPVTGCAIWHRQKQR